MADKILTFDEIMATPDREEQILPVKEWGGSVKIQTVSRERLEFLRKQATIKGKLDEDKFNQYIFQECLLEPQITGAQYEALSKKPVGPFLRVQKAIMEINGLDEGAVEEAEATFPE